MSQKYTLNRQDLNDWKRNTKRFLAPIGILYVTQVIAILMLDGHVISLTDFVPSSLTIGGVALYVLNVLYDLFNKWKNEE